MKPSRSLFALLLLLLPALATFAAEKPFAVDSRRPVRDYVVDNWRDSDGLPVDSIARMAQTTDGYLWMATERGLVRFDGTRFTTFTAKNAPTLRVEDVITLLASSDGKLWIGTRGGGASVYDGRQFSHVPIEARFIYGFAESADGAIWIATPTGIIRHHDGGYRWFSKKEGFEPNVVMALASDGADGVYLATPRGILHFNEKTKKLYDTRDGLSTLGVTSLRWTNAGLLAGNDRGGIDRLVGERFTRLPMSAPAAAIVSIDEGAAGTLWLATNGSGLLRYVSGQVEPITTRDGLTTDSLRQVLEDQQGNLWVATFGGGLVRVKQGKIDQLTLPGPLGSDFVLPMLEASDGSVWVGTDGGGLTHLKNGAMHRVTMKDGLLSNSVFAIAEARDGSIWVGTDVGLHQLIDERVVKTLTKENGLHEDGVGVVTAVSDGSLWIGTSGRGLQHIVDGQIVPTPSIPLPLSAGVVAIREASDRTLWLALNNNIVHMVGGKLVPFAPSLCLRRIAGFQIDEIDGSLWITSNDGLVRVRDGKVSFYRESDGLFSNGIYTIVQDREGNLWLPSSRGLITLERAAIEEFDAGTRARLPVSVLRKSDGLRSSDFSGGIQQPAFRARDGRLWFATTRGIVVVDPSRLKKEVEAPRVRIEQIIADNTSYFPDTATIDLPRHQRQLQIEYTAFNFYAPETTSFSYRLEGFDEKWVDAGSRRTAYYTNLPPGSYRFHVRASTLDGRTTETSSPIEIVPRFYETSYFRGGLLIVALLIALFAHRVRMNGLRAHQAELRESEEHFRSLIENASDLILVVGHDERLRYVSPSVDRLLGVTTEAMMGQKISELAVGDAVQNELDRFHSRADDTPHTATLLLRDASGASREFEAVGARTADGELVLNCRDITDRRRLEAQLEQSGRLASLGRLAATVSHEFNNVLMGIQPFVDLLQRQRTEKAVTTATTQIGRAIKRGKHISEEILRYTRPIPPTLRPVVVRDWLSELEIEIRALAGPEVRLTMVAPLGMTISADASQLNQVLTNLSINARDAGARAVRIEARLVEGDGDFAFGIVREAERFAHISFSDNGSGIPEGIRQQIFEPLFTTKTTKGTGLGLAVAQQVIARHGGEIFVESRVGSGTTFHLFLPLAVSEGGTLLRGEEEVAPSSIEAGHRVLVVEDDAAVAEGLIALLEMEEFETDLAIRGGDALAIIPRFAPDIVIVDVGLPDMSGIELFETIRSRWPRIGVIFSTGHGDMEAVLDALDSRQAIFLQKPYSVETLLAAVGALLESERSVA